MSEIEVHESADIVETQNQLLTIIDEAPPKVELIPYSRNLTSIAASECREHKLTDFLKREIPVRHGSIPSTANPGDVIATLSLPYDAMVSKMYREKANNFRFLRGTVEVRVVFNAQPFQAGLMKLLYFPVQSPIDQYNSQLTSLTQMTGLSSIDSNFENGEPMILIVPFIYPTPVYDMTAQTDPYAYIKLIVYSPPSSSSVNYFIYLRWIELDLSMPTSEPITWKQQLWESDDDEEILYPNTHNAITIKPHRDRPSYMRIMFVVSALWFLWNCFREFGLFIRRQRRRQYSVSRVQQQVGNEDNVGSGKMNLSNMARSISNVALTLSGIPLLSSIALPISTISSGIADLASYFGWSTPRSEQLTTIVRPNLVNGINNFNRLDNSHQLALDARNKTDVTKHLFGTDMDEMAFPAIWLMPQYIATLTLSTSTPAASLIGHLAIDPLTLGLTMQTTNNTATVTNLAYIASCFELYRGGIGFNFKIAKTRFHSTRIAIVYFNKTTMGDEEATYNEMTAANYHELWDIQESFQKTVCIPYIQATEWMNTSQVYNDQNRSHLGHIALYLINPLLSGGGASNTINILIESFACHDFQVAIPRTPSISGYWIAPITSQIPNTGYIRVTKHNGIYKSFSIPWNPYFKMSDKSNYELLIPPSLQYIGFTPVITSVTIKTTVGNGIIVLTFADGQERKFDINLPTYYDNNITSFFSWKYEDTINNADILNASKTHLIPILHNAYPMADMKDLVENFKMFKTAHNEFALTLFRQAHRIKSHRDVHAENKILLKKKTNFNFKGFDSFNGINKIHVLIDSDAIDKYSVVTITNEHGSINKKNIIVQFMIDKGISQQVNYNDMVHTSVLDNITGCGVELSNIVNTTIGEEIRSIRQLCARYTYYTTLTSSDVGEGFIFDMRQFVMFNPIAMHINSETSVDYISYFAPLFRFWAGEIRYKFYMESDYKPVNEVVTIRMYNNYDKSTPPSSHVPTVSTVLHIPLIEGFGEFTVPYYNRNEKIIVGDERSSGRLINPLARRIAISVRNPNTVFKCILFRAIGDNFAFGTKLSAPTVHVHPIF